MASDLSLHPAVDSLHRTPLPVWRLGVSTRLLGAPLRPHDSRRWANAPHLSVSLAYVRDILHYCSSRRIHMYRLSANLAPYATHPDMPTFHRQVQECARELAAIGDEARARQIRLTMHPASFVRLGSADEGLARRAQQELMLAARLLDAMGLDDDSVLVVHVDAPRVAHTASAQGAGGAARRVQQVSLGRFARRVEELPAPVRARLVLENGDRSADLAACLWVQRRTGAAIVLDVLHHRCNNPDQIGLSEALEVALATWRPGVRPKIHLSSPRTEVRLLRRNGAAHIVAPLANQHSDFVNVFECIDLLRAAEQRALPAFDIMLEAKAHDLALLRLREQVGVYAPEFGGRVV